MKPTKEMILDKFHFEGGELIRKDTGSTGHISPDGYVFHRICERPFGVHRLVYFLENGTWPYQVDHKNGIRSDNNPKNLRAASHAQNCMNRISSAASGVKGCYWNEKRKKYLVQVSMNEKRKTVGYFSTLEEAALEFLEASKDAYGEFARI